MSTTFAPIDPTSAPRDEAGLPALSSHEALRYSRHLLLDEVGHDGQRRLQAARVLLVGAGGLGSPAALYLAAAGIGTLGIVDFDIVDVTNLQRQVLHGTRDVGRSKLASAIDRVRDINPHVTVEPFETRLTAANALDIVREFDLVIDGTDNFPTRYLVNDACVLTGRPNVYGSIFRFEGQASVLARSEGPCYRCLFREPPPPGLVPSCAEGGVLGVLPGLVGTIQATEAIKLLLGVGRPLIGRLLLVDALDLEFRTVRVRRDPACPLCGTHEITSLVDYEDLCGLGPSRGGPWRSTLRLQTGQSSSGHPAPRCRATLPGSIPGDTAASCPCGQDRRRSQRMSGARSMHCTMRRRLRETVVAVDGATGSETRNVPRPPHGLVRVPDSSLGRNARRGGSGGKVRPLA